MIQIDTDRLPRHIAIIMDGNGRWAEKHTLGRVRGHRKGALAVRTVVKACREIGIEYLTLFAFSSENWERPVKEVQSLMFLLEEYLDKELAELQKQKIRLTTIGDIKRLTPSAKEKLLRVKEITAKNDKMVLNLALSYGAQDEIIMAVKRIIEACENHEIDANAINKETFGKYLYTSGMPDPDLMIRTSGEYRISNFLLWQMAYTELYFTKVLWPDFTKDDLYKAIVSFQRRERRFGMISGQIREKPDVMAKETGRKK